MWRTYMLLTDVEAVFRSLKSELGLRPIYHQKPQRTEGHLFISVLAYQLVQTIQHKCRISGNPSPPWTAMRWDLTNQLHITTTFRCKVSRTLHVHKATVAEPEQRTIYEILGINSAPGGIRKMTV